LPGCLGVMVYWVVLGWGWGGAPGGVGGDTSPPPPGWRNWGDIPPEIAELPIFLTGI